MRLSTGFIPGHQPIRDGQDRHQPMLAGCTDARDAAERTRTLSPKRLSVQRDSFASGSGNLPLRAIDDAMSWRARSAPLPPPPRGCQRTTRPGCSAVGRFFPSPLPQLPPESFSDSPFQGLAWALRSFRMRNPILSLVHGDTRAKGMPDTEEPKTAHKKQRPGALFFVGKKRIRRINPDPSAA